MYKNSKSRVMVETAPMDFCTVLKAIQGSLVALTNSVNTLAHDNITIKEQLHVNAHDIK